jgi:rubrerythrin
MEIFLQAADVFNFAVRIEEDGEVFYRKAARAANGEEIKKLFIRLAEEEIGHKKIFEDMLSKLEEYVPTESYSGEYMAYLRDYIDDKVVFTKDARENQFPEVRDTLSAIDFAMQRELDSILYYQEVKQFIIEKQRQAIDNIIAEERKHFALLAKIRKNYQ